MKFSQKSDLIVAALLTVQRELEPIIKDKANTHLNTKYATLGAITEYLRPLLAKHELFLMQGMEAPAVGSTVVSMETRITHSSGQWVQNRVCSPVADATGKAATVQMAGSITTYLRRYGLSALLALTTEEDDDGHAVTRQRKEAKASQRASRDLNANGVTAPSQIPFPALKGLSEWKGKPLADVPTEPITEAYTRAKADPSKNAQLVARAMEDELERRRVASDFGTLHPALAEEAHSNGSR